MDRILVVDCPEAIQRKRILLRDPSFQSQLEQILALQLPRDQRLQYADDVLDNSGTLSELAQKVQQLHQQYLKLAN